MGLIGWGATGVVDRLGSCGVRFGLSFGDELVEFGETVELGLVITLDQGFLSWFGAMVGVVLRLVAEDTDDAAGDGGPRFENLQ
jgi:hypothetical protein